MKKRNMMIFRFQLEYAGMAELADAPDLGDVTSVKEFGFITHRNYFFDKGRFILFL